MRRVATIAIIAGLTATAAVLLWELREILFLFFLAVVAGAAIKPLVAGCAKRGIPRKWALAFTYAGILLVLAVILVVIGGALIDELARVAARLTLGYPALVARWSEGGAVARALVEALPAPESFSAALHSMQPAELAHGALAVTTAALRTVGAAVVVLALSAYWISNRKTFERLALSFVAAGRRSHVRTLTEAIERDVGRHVLAESLGALLAVIGAALVFHAMSLPYPTIPAVFAGLARLVPVAGPAFAAAVAAVAAGIESPTGPGAIAVGTLAAVATIAWLRIVDRVVVRRLLATPAPSPLVAVISVVLLTSSGLWWALPIASPIALAVQIAVRRAARARRADWNGDASARELLAWVRERHAELAPRIAHWRDTGGDAPHLAALGDRLSGIVREVCDIADPKAGAGNRAA